MSEKEKVIVKITVQEECPKCEAVGYIEKVPGVKKLCPLCHGTGERDIVFDKKTKLQIKGG